MSRWHLIAISVYGVLVLTCTGGAGGSALAQPSKPSTVLVLPDPTPRPIDLDKVYQQRDKDGKKLSPEQISAYNKKRYELIKQASSQMTTLAGRLQERIANRTSGAPLQPEIQVAMSIEVLANDVHGAVSPTEKRPAKDKRNPVSTESFQASDFAAGTQKLTQLIQELEKEVSRSTPGTLSVGVFNKSDQVGKLAHDLKESFAHAAAESSNEPAR